jgi:hypothetical protein
MQSLSYKDLDMVILVCLSVYWVPVRGNLPFCHVISVVPAALTVNVKVLCYQNSNFIILVELPCMFLLTIRCLSIHLMICFFNYDFS